MNNDAKYPEISVQLSGEDGSVFSIIGRVRRAMRNAKVPNEEIERFSAEMNNAESYDHALRCVMRWVDAA